MPKDKFFLDIKIGYKALKYGLVSNVSNQPRSHIEEGDPHPLSKILERATDMGKEARCLIFGKASEELPSMMTVGIRSLGIH